MFPLRLIVRSSFVVSLTDRRAGIASTTQPIHVFTMSIWTRIVELPEEFQQQVYMLYNDQFPIEMRTSLADWFEVQQWYNYSNITSTVAFKLFEDLMKEFSVVVALTENIALKIKLEQILQSVQITYSRDPTNYIRLVCQCLSNERKILHSAQNVRIIECPFFHWVAGLLVGVLVH